MARICVTFRLDTWPVPSAPTCALVRPAIWLVVRACSCFAVSSPMCVVLSAGQLASVLSAATTVGAEAVELARTVSAFSCVLVSAAAWGG